MEKSYGDFVFEFEFKVDSKMNLGIQVCSEVDFEKGCVFGYQIEIDFLECVWMGGFYDEVCWGWFYLFDVNQDVCVVFCQGEWNEFCIECIGFLICSWFNGVLVIYLFDDMMVEGFIGLQVYVFYFGVVDDGEKVWWCNLWIKIEGFQFVVDVVLFVVNCFVNSLSVVEEVFGWFLIFDGESMNGWCLVYGELGVFGGCWLIEEGVFVVGGDLFYFEGCDVVFD